MPSESLIFVRPDQDRAVLRTGVTLGTLVFLIFVFFATMISVGFMLRRFVGLGQAEGLIAVLSGMLVAFTLTGAVGFQIRRELRALGTSRIVTPRPVRVVFIGMVVVGMIVIPVFQLLFEGKNLWYAMLQVFFGCWVLVSLWKLANRRNSDVVDLSDFNPNR